MQIWPAVCIVGASCAQRGHLVQVLVARTAPFDFCQFRPVAGRAPEINRKKTRLPDSNSKKPAAGTSAAGTAVDIFIPRFCMEYYRIRNTC